jgi:hypothetical protein
MLARLSRSEREELIRLVARVAHGGLGSFNRGFRGTGICRGGGLASFFNLLIAFAQCFLQKLELFLRRSKFLLLGLKNLAQLSHFGRDLRADLCHSGFRGLRGLGSSSRVLGYAF